VVNAETPSHVALTPIKISAKLSSASGVENVIIDAAIELLPQFDG
jgi:hypothetical protein